MKLFGDYCLTADMCRQCTGTASPAVIKVLPGHREATAHALEWYALITLPHSGFLKEHMHL